MHLYAVPDKLFINDINFVTVNVHKDLSLAIIKYQVKYFVEAHVSRDATVCKVELFDKLRTPMGEKSSCVGEITVGKTT